MENLNRVLLENVLPAHVAEHFLGRNWKNEVNSKSYSFIIYIFIYLFIFLALVLVIVWYFGKYADRLSVILDELREL